MSVPDGHSLNPVVDEVAKLRLTPQDTTFCDEVRDAAWLFYPDPRQIRSRRRLVLTAICTKLGCTSWFWCHSYVHAAGTAPVTMEGDSFNPSLKRGMLLAVREQSGDSGVAPENPMFNTLIDEGRHFTRSMTQLSTSWTDRERHQEREFSRDLNANERLYSIMPLQRQGEMTTFSGVGTSRQWTDPLFSPYEVRFFHVALATCGFVFEASGRALRPSTASILNRCARPVFSLMKFGFPRREVIAEAKPLLGADPKSIQTALRRATRGR